MNRFRGAGLGIRSGSAALALTLTLSCSRPVGLHDSPTATDQHQVPFHEGDANAAASPNATSPATTDHSNTDGSLPFRDSRSLPAGTLLSVRLKNPIAADSPVTSRTFEGIIDEPVAIEGNTLVPSGASVAVRVEAAGASQVKRNPGYVRLTLDSIDIAGHDLPVQTSSLFARGQAQASSPQKDPSIHDPRVHDPRVQGISLEKGRRLTFRLTEPLYVDGQHPVAGH